MKTKTDRNIQILEELEEQKLDRVQIIFNEDGSVCVINNGKGMEKLRNLLLKNGTPN